MPLIVTVFVVTVVVMAIVVTIALPHFMAPVAFIVVTESVAPGQCH
jgi:hypothetical protein